MAGDLTWSKGIDDIAKSREGLVDHFSFREKFSLCSCSFNFFRSCQINKINFPCLHASWSCHHISHVRCKFLGKWISLLRTKHWDMAVCKWNINNSCLQCKTQKTWVLRTSACQVSCCAYSIVDEFCLPSILTVCLLYSEKKDTVTPATFSIHFW